MKFVHAPCEPSADLDRAVWRLLFARKSHCKGLWLFLETARKFACSDCPALAETELAEHWPPYSSEPALSFILFGHHLAHDIRVWWERRDPHEQHGGEVTGDGWKRLWFAETKFNRYEGYSLELVLCRGIVGAAEEKVRNGSQT